METSPNIFPATAENTCSNKARTATRTNGDCLPTTAPWEDPVLRKAVGVVIAGKKLAGQPQARNWSTQSRQYQNASTTWYLPNDSCREESIHLGVLTYSQRTGNKRAYEMTGSSALPDLREQRSLVARKTSFFHNLFPHLCTIFLLMHNLSPEMKTALSTKLQKQKTQSTRKTRCYCWSP